MKIQKLMLVIEIGFVFLLIGFNVSGMKPDHPNYLHALSDLRAARWMLEHQPGNWQRTTDEVEAVKQIDAAINDIKKTAIDFLKKEREDVSKEEDNNFAQGLRARALKHIDEAIKLTEKAIQS